MSILDYSEQIKVAIRKIGRALDFSQKEDASQNCYLALLEIQGVLSGIVRDHGQEAANQYAYVTSRNTIIEMYNLKIDKTKLVSLSDPKVFQEAQSSLPEAKNKEPLFQKLEDAVADLPGRERYVITQLYEAEKTGREVGATLGVKKARISRIKKSALKKLKNKMETE